MGNNNRTLTQEYAYYAFKCIEQIKNKYPHARKDYTARVRKLPSMITHNGLLTTLSFLYAKSDFKKKIEDEEKTKKPSSDYNGSKGIKQDEKKTKQPNADLILLNHLVVWLEKDFQKMENLTENRKAQLGNFIKTLTEMDFQRLMINSRRALTLAQWLKRLAEGEFKDAKQD